MDKDELGIEQQKLEVERQKLQLDRESYQLEQAKHRSERSKTRLTAASVIVSALAILALNVNERMQISADFSKQKSQLEADLSKEMAREKEDLRVKAMELALQGDNPQSAINRAKILSDLAPNELGPEFLQKLHDPTAYGEPNRRGLMQLIAQHPESAEDTMLAWQAIFPNDAFAAQALSTFRSLHDKDSAPAKASTTSRRHYASANRRYPKFAKDFRRFGVQQPGSLDWMLGRKGKSGGPGRFHGRMK